MDEYIERGALMQFPIRRNHYDRKNGNKHFINGVESVLEYAENLPAADVAPVIHAHWVSASKKQGVNIGMKCSLCGARIKNSEFFNGNHNYCHKCGAKMDEKEDR